MIEDDEWKFELHKLMHDYGELRQEYYQLSTQYYRQNPYSDYISEDEIIDILSKCRDLRNRMNSLSKKHYPDSNGVAYQGNFMQRRDWNGVPVTFLEATR